MFMKELITLSKKRINWCNSFLIKCINVIKKTEPVDPDGYPSIEQLNKMLTHDAGFRNIDLELVYMLRKLENLKKNCT